MTAVTQQEALENYEKNQYATEEQEKPAKQKEKGKKRNSGTAYGKNRDTSCSLGCIHFLKSLSLKKFPMHCFSVQFLLFYTLSFQIHKFMCAAKEVSLRKHRKAKFHLTVKLELNRSYFREYDGGTPFETSVLHCGEVAEVGSILLPLKESALACRTCF